MSKKKQTDPYIDKFYETYSKVRRDWGEMKPYSKTIKSQKDYSRHPKHKKDIYVESEEIE